MNYSRPQRSNDSTNSPVLVAHSDYQSNHNQIKTKSLDRSKPLDDLGLECCASGGKLPREFSQKIEQELCQGSAIAPELFQSAVSFVEDTGRWETYEAVGFEVRTQWQTRKPHDFGLLAGLKNEDGSFWQFKPEHPLTDSKGKAQKYQTPKGNGSRAFLPTIPDRIRQLISKRYGVTVPSDGSFWQWLEQHPEIPIIWTEGGKKALALLSQGYVAIALYGVHGGYRVDGFLIPDVVRFTQPGRLHTLAFDEDSKEKTRHKVERALAKFGRCLEVTGGAVKVATWQPEQGKGVDDLIVQGGAAAWETAYSEALPLLHWQLWNRLDRRLTWQPNLRVNTSDLSTLSLDQIPESGIIAIASAKGTGKTKLTGQLVKQSDRTLALGHRITLMRNLSERLGLDYRGDLDKTPDGRFINGAGYTLRVGSCVDSLLAINPDQFAGCDLLIPETVQVVRHLLTSSTCSQDGKRPALLAQLHQLIRVARRVILDDADLDNATLDYFKQLRGDNAPVFLIRNDCQSSAYSVRLVRSNSFEPVVSDILDDLHQLEPGKTLMVCTDTKRSTKAIARLVANSCPGKRVLIVNSDTSGGEAEREFIETPDAVLQRGDYDLIICSPSLATGVSIEAQGIVKRVYGIFTGFSLTDADIAQFLIRVREPVERVVWVAAQGRNYSKVSRSTNHLIIKRALLEQTSINVALARSSLREDTIASVHAVDWQSDPHLNLYCQLAAEQNRSMLNLRDAVLVRLKHEGHQVTIEDREFDPVARFLYRQAATEQKRHDAQVIFQADIKNYAEVKLLEQKESRTPEEERSIQRFYLCDFYCLAPQDLTPEFVLSDSNGQRRAELRSLEGLLYPELAIATTASGIEKQATWNQGNCPWDISGAALRAELRRKLGLEQFLDPDREWIKDDCADVAAIARQHSRQIQDVLHFTPSAKLSDVQIVHQLLSQLGIKITHRWQGSGAEKHRVYRLEAQTWQALTEILERRQDRRLRLAESEKSGGSPPKLINQKLGGDPQPESSQELAKWLSEDCLADVREWWQQADTPELVEEVRRLVPLEVLERAIAV